MSSEVFSEAVLDDEESPTKTNTGKTLLLHLALQCKEPETLGQARPTDRRPWVPADSAGQEHLRQPVPWVRNF